VHLSVTVSRIEKSCHVGRLACGTMGACESSCSRSFVAPPSPGCR
jgi:hypothetical protein